MPYRITGIDVHKKMLAVVVADVEIDGEYLFERQKVGTSPADLRTLADWLVAREVEEVVMESTAQVPGGRCGKPWSSTGARSAGRAWALRGCALHPERLAREGQGQQLAAGPEECRVQTGAAPLCAKEGSRRWHVGTATGEARELKLPMSGAPEAPLNFTLRRPRRNARDAYRYKRRDPSQEHRYDATQPIPRT